MRASLAIVAQAPLAAVVSVSTCPIPMGTANSELPYQLREGDVCHLLCFHRPILLQPRKCQNIQHEQDLQYLVRELPIFILQRACNTPAPTMTLDTPLHNVRRPSIRYIVETACDNPVYRPPAEGFMICIRVCGQGRLAMYSARQGSETEPYLH